LLLATGTTAVFTDISHRLLKYVANITGQSERQIENRYTVYFGMTVAGEQPVHEKLNVTNPNSFKLNLHLSGAEKDHSKDVEEKDYGFEVYIPLTLEGGALCVELPQEKNIELPQEKNMKKAGRKSYESNFNGAQSDSTPYYIAFGTGLMVRGDCFRAGWYGDHGTKMLRVLIVSNKVPCAGPKLYINEELKNLQASDNLIQTLMLEPKFVLAAARRPTDINSTEKRHSNYQALDKYKTTMLENFNSFEYEYIFDRNTGDGNMKANFNKAELMDSHEDLFKTFPNWKQVDDEGTPDGKKRKKSPAVDKGEKGRTTKSPAVDEGGKGHTTKKQKGRKS
jgi:hypothetical protein